MLAPNTILQNRYRIVRELGHGGMGAVYEAIDQRVSCVVALKETLIGKDSFEREAALLANLRHSGLPKVMDYFSEGEGEFLVMEFIPGHDLAELMELRGGPFPEPQVLRWADEILRVVEYLHSRQPPILHRDIKPSNLKVTKDGEVFLLDFGLAKGAAGQMQTLMTDKSVLGYTPVYSPLEQIHGRGTDPRSDLYALGATLYHLLTGHAPTDAPTRYIAIEDEEPDPLLAPAEISAHVSATVSAVVLQAVSLSRRRRPASASEMRAALKQAVGDAKLEERHRQEAGTLPKLADRRNLDQPKAEGVKEPLRPTEPAKEPAPRQIQPTLPAEAEAKQIAQPTAKQPTIPGPYLPQAAPRLEPSGTTTDPIIANRTLAGDTSSRASSRWPLIAFAFIIVLVIIGGVGIYWLASRDNPPATPAANQNVVATPDRSPPAAPPAPSGMVYVPGGEFTMGRDDGDEYERPAHKVSLAPFFIDSDEVTCEEYAKFIKVTHHITPADFDCGKARWPVHDVRWDDANAFAKWAGKRLPTEQEWELAARGTDERRYPWGNTWTQGMANITFVTDRTANTTALHDGKLEEVGMFKGVSPFGLLDMIGNVWEWTASSLTAYPGGQLPIKPTSDMRVIRGGAYDSDENAATTTYRRGYPASGNYDYSKIGFRCVRDVK